MRKRRRLNRDLVIEQAVLLADDREEGAAISLTALAQALEIQPPSLYNHVAGLEDLEQGMAAYGLRRLLIDLRQASMGLVGREAIMAMAAAYRHFAHSHPGIYPLTIRAPENDEAELIALSQELLQMLRLVMASMGMQGDDAIHAIRGLRAVLHGFTSLEAADGYKMSLDMEESFHRLLNAYLDGLT